jgi:hypothetical protein
MITVLLFGIALNGTEPSKPVMTALSALSSGMLCANLIGVVLGFVGAEDRSSRKRYPLLGLALNIAVPMTFMALALVGLSMNAP